MNEIDPLQETSHPEAPPPFPAIARVIGGFFVFIGAMSVAMDLVFLFLVIPVFLKEVPMEELQEGAPPGFDLLFGYLDVWVTAYLLLCALLTVAAIQFLRRRNWARLTLEGISWLGALYTLGFGVYWLTMVGDLTQNAPEPEGMPIRAFMLAGGVAATVFYLAIIGGILYVLRMQAVRRAMIR